MNQELIHLFEVAALLILVGIFYISPFDLKVDEEDDDE
jgi:hypothetical protein